jgi:hypothetical protein
VKGVLADKDADAANGTQPDCTVIDHTFDASGNRVDTPVPACADNGSSPPCWSLAPDPMCPSAGTGAAEDNRRIGIMRPAGPTPNDLNNTVACSICIPNILDPKCNNCGAGGQTCCPGQVCKDGQACNNGTCP